jgi:hypothetical protein
MDPSTDRLDILTSISKAKTFLGREFLTWLWFTAETRKDPKELTHPRTGMPLSFDLWIDDRMVLEAVARVAALSHQSVMKGGDPSHSREAAAALAAGKIVRELKVGFNVKGIGEFSAVLGSEDLSPRALKLPTSKGDGGQGESGALPLSVRIQHMEIFLSALDLLFAQFLKARTSDQWEEESLQDIREWIKIRQQDEESGTLH